MGEHYPWGENMSDDLGGNKITVISQGDLGPENQGGFGPTAEHEIKAVDNLADQKYVLRSVPEFHCMDDRFFGQGIQLAGGRVWTEVAGFYMDPLAQPKPLSEAVRHITSGLVARGNRIFDHGDEHQSEEGCAAKKFVRTVITYNNQHLPVVAPLTLGVLKAMDLDTQNSPNEIRNAIEVGNKRAFASELWDIDSNRATEIIVSSGGEYEIMPGEHKVAAGRTSLSDDIFDNHTFYKEYGVGALSVTLGAYKKHLEEEGVSDIPKKIMHATLFAFGAKKILLKDHVQEVIVAA